MSLTPERLEALAAEAEAVGKRSLDLARQLRVEADRVRGETCDDDKDLPADRDLLGAADGLRSVTGVWSELEKELWYWGCLWLGDGLDESALADIAESLAYGLGAES